jgi:F420H(2)-dependent quinone reductase
MAESRARTRATRPLARLLNLASRFPRMEAAGSRFHARLYARSAGRRGGRWFGVPVLVIETIGCRSGRPRATPIVYVRDGDRLLVTPANAGAEKTPAWWLNLRAAGEGVAVIRGRRTPMRPSVLEGAEADRAWRAMERVLPAIEDYRTFTERRFPVVALEPVGRDAAVRGHAPAVSSWAR